MCSQLGKLRHEEMNWSKVTANFNPCTSLRWKWLHWCQWGSFGLHVTVSISTDGQQQHSVVTEQNPLLPVATSNQPSERTKQNFPVPEFVAEMRLPLCMTRNCTWRAWMCYHLAKTQIWGSWWLGWVFSDIEGVCFVLVIQAHQLSLPLHAEQFLLQLKRERPLLVGTKEGTKYNKSLFLSIAHACADFSLGTALA